MGIKGEGEQNGRRRGMGERESESVPWGISKKAIFQSTSDLSTSRLHEMASAHVLRATSRSGLMPLAATWLFIRSPSALHLSMRRYTRIFASSRVFSISVIDFRATGFFYLGGNRFDRSFRSSCEYSVIFNQKSNFLSIPLRDLS